MKVVFVASLVHSGSTLLDLMLGAHEELIGLGEMWSFLHPELRHLDHVDELRCSCGKRMDHCPFWGDVIARADGALEDRYATLVEVFRERYPDRALVDSSKSLEALRVWLAWPRLDLRVLHLIRDVRGWSLSMRELAQRTGRSERGWRVLRQWAAETTANRFRQWYLGNRAIERFVVERGLAATTIGYDELCTHPERVLPRLCRFLGVEPRDAMLSIGDSASHIALGNRMLRDARRRSRVVYDDRWRDDRRWRLPARLLRPVMRYNRQRVWGDEGVGG